MLKNKFDDALFYWLSNGKLEGVISCHVDDFVWGGSINLKEQVINVLKEIFFASLQITWCDRRSQLAECVTKVGTSCRKLIYVIKGNGKLLQVS